MTADPVSHLRKLQTRATTSPTIGCPASNEPDHVFLLVDGDRDHGYRWEILTPNLGKLPLNEASKSLRFGSPEALQLKVAVSHGLFFQVLHWPKGLGVTCDTNRGWDFLDGNAHFGDEKAVFVLNGVPEGTPGREFEIDLEPEGESEIEVFAYKGVGRDYLFFRNDLEKVSLGVFQNLHTIHLPAGHSLHLKTSEDSPLVLVDITFQDSSWVKKRREERGFRVSTTVRKDTDTSWTSFTLRFLDRQPTNGDKPFSLTLDFDPTIVHRGSTNLDT